MSLAIKEKEKQASERERANELSLHGKCCLGTTNDGSLVLIFTNLYSNNGGKLENSK